MDKERAPVVTLWEQTQSELQHDLSPQVFHTWVRPLRPMAYEEGILKIEVPSAFFKEWLEDHHRDLIQTAVSKSAGKPTLVQFLIPESRPDGTTPLFRNAPPPAPVPAVDPLFAKYDFTNFVVGPGNRFAHAACLAVAEAPGRTYNPLFLYGGVGLGKTHLLCAIGRSVRERQQQAKIIYLTSEAFMNEMITMLRQGRMAEFRGKYRTADVLLIDDVQFLEGKESTQQEFFHTFNALYEAGRQIVASSDSHPRNVSLMERLRSRFEMGLVADIQAPDFETRMAILLRRAEHERMPVPQDVLTLLAERITSNIRQLEGGLVRLLAYATLTKRAITLEMAHDVLKDALGAAAPALLSIERIQQTVTSYFALQPTDMQIKQRTRSVAYPRMLAMYLCRELTHNSLPEIGKAFGGRDHTTVIHACRTIKQRLTTDPQTHRHLQDLMQQLRETGATH